MISCMILERSGAWRAVSAATLFVIVVLPTAPLLWSAMASLASAPVIIDSGFMSAGKNSAAVAMLVTIVSLVAGLPAGVITALYEFPGRRIFLALTTLPLLVPSFLWAIGWSALATRLGPAVASFITGVTGCVLVFFGAAVALVLLTAYVASATVSGSQVAAARLAGGERTVLSYTVCYAFTPALLAAGLAGVLTLSDPGPGQILGVRTVAAEILTSFSALYDFALAGRQCIALTLFVLFAAAPFAYGVAHRLASELMAKQLQVVQRIQSRTIAVVALPPFALPVLAGTIAPLLGLLLPLVEDTAWERAWGEFIRTVGDTLFYAVGAGAVAATLGLLLALCVGRQERLRTFCIGMLLALFSLPPALAALGLVQITAATPAWTDAFLRSRLTVCTALGFRFFPVAAILGLRAWGATSASWVQVAAVHGVPLPMYLWRVVLPLLLPTGAVAMLLIALLATADISTVLLLHPPGARSLPLAIFTVMANAPEPLVASLCLVYVGTAAVLLAAIWALASRAKQ